jgi:hypothetical protein
MLLDKRIAVLAFTVALCGTLEAQTPPSPDPPQVQRSAHGVGPRRSQVMWSSRPDSTFDLGGSAFVAPMSRGRSVTTIALVGAAVGGLLMYAQSSKSDSNQPVVDVALGVVVGAGVGAIIGLFVAPSPSPPP